MCKGNCGANSWGEFSGGVCDNCWESRNDTIKNTLKIACGAVVAFAMIDMAGLALWVLSGQVPPDNFYIGSMTAHVLRALIGS